MQAAVAFLGKETCSAAPCTQSACKLQESLFVFEQGLLSKPACIISPLRQPACIVTVWGEARGGEQITKKFRKTRKMTSLEPPPAGNQAFREPELIATDFGTSRKQGPLPPSGQSANAARTVIFIYFRRCM